MKICVVTDNEYLYETFFSLVEKGVFGENQFVFFYSSCNSRFTLKYVNSNFYSINLQKMDNLFFDSYDIFLSLHSKQIFPASLVNRKFCINVHPGFNPYNRGWFPQVFSIINKQPVGVTIHKMDTKLDHGPILFQEQVPIFDWDTSYDVYKRIQELEIRMLEENLPKILCQNYMEIPMTSDGNVNYKHDFLRLCEINLSESCTYGEAIDRLRALTFENYNNAFFVTEEGKKIFVQIKLTPE